MWHQLFFLLPLILSASSITVPVDKTDNADDQPTIAQEEEHSTPLYYIKEDANIDSYLVPPDPHKPETYSDIIVTPATYLLPPVKEQPDFYAPAEPSGQSDWLPILQAQTQNQRNARFQKPLTESIPIFLNDGTHHLDGRRFAVPLPIPATQLLPPLVDAVNEFYTAEVPETEQNQPNQVANIPIYEDDKNSPLVSPQLEFVEPTLALHLVPPKFQQTLKLPTKLYPKKYPSDFKPVPIPLRQFTHENEPKFPAAKPAKYFQPPSSVEIEEFTPTDEKNLYHYKKAEHQRKLKGEDESVKEHHDGAVAQTHGEPTSSEQETSETNFRYPGRNVYPAPVRQAAAPAPPRAPSPAAAPAPDGRTEFRMHGMKGPHSYQFGYDTGKGKNRQFRYEERDNDGLVHGHYGYMDKLGKLRVVNYSAHPEHGFHAEEPVEKE